MGRIILVWAYLLLHPFGQPRLWSLKRREAKKTEEAVNMQFMHLKMKSARHILWRSELHGVVDNSVRCVLERKMPTCSKLPFSEGTLASGSTSMPAHASPPEFRIDLHKNTACLPGVALIFTSQYRSSTTPVQICVICRCPSSKTSSRPALQKTGR